MLVSFFDSTMYEEPDGTIWVRVMHHNNPASNLFASSDKFTENVYKSENVWFIGALFNSMDRWEVMVKQKQTSSSSEEKYRWTQPANPMTCGYADVLASKITRNTSSGYSTNGYGGLWKKNGSTYLAAENGTNGSNWMGAMGSWTAWSGGIPGWGSAITTGYMDLYARVDNVIVDTLRVSDTNIIANSFVEL